MKVFNAGGQLIETVTFLYDGNGNTLQKVRATTTTYAYDLENRLTEVTLGGSTQATYAYFSDGSRIRRTAGGTTTYFLYDFRDFNGFNDVLSEYDSSGGMVARYIHGPSVDEPMAMSRGGSWYYYHVDGLGSVTMLTDAAKIVKNRWVYDDFGAFRSKTEAISNSYGFTGRETDVVGLIYYRARYYDTEIGRFVTRDPAGNVDRRNYYTYAGNNPASNVDPSGLSFGSWNFWWLKCTKPGASWWNWPLYQGTWHFNWDAFFGCLALKAVLDPYTAWRCVYGLTTTCSYFVWFAIVTTFTDQWEAIWAAWASAGACAVYYCAIPIFWLFICAIQSRECR